MSEQGNDLAKEDVKEFMHKLTSSELKDIIKRNDKNKTASNSMHWWSGSTNWKSR